jgi:hypothetical protein
MLRQLILNYCGIVSLVFQADPDGLYVVVGIDGSVIKNSNLL